MTPITFTHSLYNDTTHSHLPTCRSRMCSRPTVVSVLAVGRAVGRVAVLAVLLAVCGPVLIWLPTVCHACLLGRPGRGQVTWWRGETSRVRTAVWGEPQDEHCMVELIKSATRGREVPRYPSAGSAFVWASTCWDWRERLREYTFLFSFLIPFVCSVLHQIWLPKKASTKCFLSVRWTGGVWHYHLPQNGI